MYGIWNKHRIVRAHQTAGNIRYPFAYVCTFCMKWQNAHTHIVRFYAKSTPAVVTWNLFEYWNRCSFFDCCQTENGYQTKVAQTMMIRHIMHRNVPSPAMEKNHNSECRNCQRCESTVREWERFSSIQYVEEIYSFNNTTITRMKPFRLHFLLIWLLALLLPNAAKDESIE